MSKKTRIAVVGAGHWGPNLIRNFHSSDRSEVACVVETATGRHENISARFPDVTVTADLRVALDDDSIDAFVVATPTVTHYEIVEAALQRGKHVLVEKPITSDPAQADRLCALAEEKGVTLLVGHVFLFNDGIRAVKSMIDQGDLGGIYYVSMVRTNLGPIRMDVGAHWDLATHDVSIANYWLGAEPVAVTASGGQWINEGIHDAIFATLRYESGVLVNLHASWLNPRKARDITVVGDKKMLTFDDLNVAEPIRLYDKSVLEDEQKPPFIDSIGTFRASVRNGNIVIPQIGLGEPLRNECEYFLQCIAGQHAEPLSDGRFGASLVHTLAAIERSARAGGKEEKVRS